MTPILLVGADHQVQAQTHAILTAEGLGPIACLQAAAEVRTYLGEHPCELLLLDIGQASPQDIGVIGEITRSHPQIRVVAISQADEAAAAVSCIHQGAYDYLVKPIVSERLMDVIRRAMGLKRLRQAPRATKGGASDAFTDLITADPGMHEIFAYVGTVARSGQPLLITGETGTGKDLLARAVHRLSGRAGDFVAVNIAGMDDSMLADCLYGHRKGAFTGANDLRPGLVLAASAGTLFLDEIGDLAPVSQVKLLRLLQDGEYYPLGSDTAKHSTARIIAASNADLRALKADGRFRRDLYFRLRAHAVELPPLRSRPGDIPLLAHHFAISAAAELGSPPVEVTDEALALLEGYSFPGNIRELRSLVYDAVSRTPDGGPLSLLPFRQATREHEGARAPAKGQSILRFPEQLPTLEEVQDLLVREALTRAKGNQALAASWLGITRQAVHKRLQR